MKRFNDVKGFTLVELIVVIAIIAILASVSVVGYQRYVDQGRFSNDTQVAASMTNVLQNHLISDPTYELNASAVRSLINFYHGEEFDFTPTSNNTGYFFIESTNEVIVEKYADIDENPLFTQLDLKTTLLNDDGNQQLDTPSYANTPEELFGEGTFLLSTGGSPIAVVVNMISNVLPSVGNFAATVDSFESELESYDKWYLTLFNQGSFIKDKVEELWTYYHPSTTLYVGNDSWATTAGLGGNSNVVERIFVGTGVTNIPKFSLVSESTIATYYPAGPDYTDYGAKDVGGTWQGPFEYDNTDYIAAGTEENPTGTHVKVEVTGWELVLPSEITLPDRVRSIEDGAFPDVFPNNLDVAFPEGVRVSQFGFDSKHEVMLQTAGVTPSTISLKNLDSIVSATKTTTDIGSIQDFNLKLLQSSLREDNVTLSGFELVINGGDSYYVKVYSREFGFYGVANFTNREYQITFMSNFEREYIASMVYTYTIEDNIYYVTHTKQNSLATSPFQKGSYMAPERDGYDFEGWSLTQDIPSEVIDFSAYTLTDDVVLWAQWSLQ